MLNDIKKVCCYGADLTGASWALDFAINGCEVILYDGLQEQLDHAFSFIRTAISSLNQNDILSLGNVEKALARISMTTDVRAALSDVQYIQESDKEDIAVKHQIVEDIENYASSECLCGTSSSGVFISDYVKPAVHKERYIAARPYFVPHLFPIVEIACIPETNPKAVEIVTDFFKGIKKIPVFVKRDTRDSICKRLQYTAEREIRDLVGKGVCTLDEADKALTFGPGMRWGLMGPTLIMQLAAVGGPKALLANLNSSGINPLAFVAKWLVQPEYVGKQYYSQSKNMEGEYPYGESDAIQLINWVEKGLIKINRYHGIM